MATFRDFGFTSATAGTAETFTATIDWGDSSSVPAGVSVVNGNSGSPTIGTVHGEHHYANDGTYTVSVTVRDDDGGVGTASFLVRVANATPVVVAPGPLNGAEGASLQLTTTFGDPGAA